MRPVSEAIKREHLAIQQKAESVNQRNWAGREKILEEMKSKLSLEQDRQNEFQASLLSHRNVWLDMERKRRTVRYPWYGHTPNTLLLSSFMAYHFYCQASQERLARDEMERNMERVH